MKPEEIYLNKEQREELTAFVKKGKHDVRLVNRAKVILALDRTDKKDHLRIGRICESVGITRSTICDIRKAFFSASSVEEFLKRKKRETPPIPPKITGNVEARIIALACSEPPTGCARWTLKMLANKSVELGFIESISDVSVHTLLKKRNISLI